MPQLRGNEPILGLNMVHGEEEPRTEFKEQLSVSY
jgi:hypothetical protein